MLTTAKYPKIVHMYVKEVINYELRSPSDQINESKTKMCVSLCLSSSVLSCVSHNHVCVCMCTSACVVSCSSTASNRNGFSDPL